MATEILPKSLIKKLTIIIGCAYGLYHLFALGIWITYPMHLHMVLHLFPILLLIFLTHAHTRQRRDHFTLVELTPCLLTLATGIYFIIYAQGLYDRIMMPTPEYALNTADYFFGVLLLILCFEAARRIIGVIYLAVIALFILIAIYGQYLPVKLSTPPLSWSDFIEAGLWTYDSGVWAVPLRVAATLIIIFFIFGELLQESGIASLFISLSKALAARARGGPAKISVISSGLIGSITGGPATNIVLTGSFTIPMMKQIGYKPHYAGAVECAASTGSSIMPPVMTGIAFLMAELVGVPYVKVMIVSVFPAILYFLSVFMQVHYQALKLGMVGSTEKHDIVHEVLIVLKEKGHLLVPIVILVILLFLDYPATMAAFWAIITIVVVGSLRKSTRIGLKRTLLAIGNAAQDMALITIASALAGFILFGLYTTGLAAAISHYASLLIENSLLIGIVFGGIVCLILGMGAPVIACYLITVLIVSPIMVKSGVEMIVAHLFCLYMANMAFITPPVAVGAFVAANLAKASFWRVGFTGLRLALAGLVVPIAFCYRPGMVLHGSIPEILVAVVFGVIMVISMASALEGWLLRKSNILERVVMAGVCIGLVLPHVLMNIGAIMLFALLILWQGIEKLRARKIRP
jgi:TRAP transporter 4TM/12TM fusion protein